MHVISLKFMIKMISTNGDPNLEQSLNWYIHSLSKLWIFSYMFINLGKQAYRIRYSSQIVRGLL